MSGGGSIREQTARGRDGAGGPIQLYGLMAEFEQPEPLIAAARRAHAAGYRRLEAYTPFPVEELDEVLHLPASRVPIYTLAGAILGGGGAYFMLWYSSTVDWPWNVGGRPFNSWPAFIPITFELTVLGASLAAVFSMLILNRFTRLYHPVWNTPSFQRASRDRFFLCIKAEDPLFDRSATHAFMAGDQPLAVHEVEA